ncbi:pyridine nucleotide-disulfide oxidoreductase family protein [Paraburkholderia xenovorans LB400]|uniref:FAD-dependent pyridine nucleotide-disulfide oxidoreductase n=1 Tax=Paraburkholderia xenovorans (strain LB400) TaxID=266265 RepID=Q13IA3_PARXL|nr:NAD(P)/FAD-dependent oxidoreductase [Paraburkholderia xenovorans]ABE36186.1 FAD-dependent pyridine nucleotide-disulfide oxidoreductase [Paraburkholderia xenovorans LB400]AIP35192.1 pyridine nucleotide-disulfide oxidoreductase family protein [Paraburkholderia xenovorans LB400]
MTQPVRIVIVGGGIAGLLLATRLGNRLGRRGEAHVTLVDRSPTHIWKPMLHTIAAGTTDVHQQQVFYLTHARAHGFTYRPGEMCGIDRDTQQIQLAALAMPNGEVVMGPGTLGYDILVLSTGSRANDFGTPGVPEHCHFIDSQPQAEAFNEAIRSRIVRSVVENEPLRVAIVGAGATGVELAAELSHLLDVASSYGDASIRARLHLGLYESAPRVLTAFPPDISASSEALLRRLGFEVHTRTRVTEARAQRLRLNDGSEVAADLMVWAAGVKAPDFLGKLPGIEASHANQLFVRPTLQTTHDDHIFALGDCASLTPPGNERPLPPTAQVATQQAEHLAKHLPRWLNGEPLPEFTFRDFGALVSLSDYNAFGTLGKFGFFKGGFIRGRFAQISHAMLYRRHQQALHGFGKASLLWTAERINALVQPKIRLK